MMFDPVPTRSRLRAMGHDKALKLAGARHKVSICKLLGS